MRRNAPRPLSGALDRVTRDAAPATLLARVQARWPGVAGKVVATEATPVAEGGGRVTIACSSATWAQELALLEPDLRGRLNECLGGTAGAPVRTLRFRAAAAR